MAIDPVCNMEVDEASPAGKTDHLGQTYYFCSGGCLKMFEKEPDRYLGEDADTSSHMTAAPAEAPSRSFLGKLFGKK